MSSPGPNRFMEVIDDLTTAKILMIAVLITFVPAGIYTGLSMRCTVDACKDGLSSDDKTPISFLDASYFSVVTETTVGYGDIKPHGWSRLIACFQILSGLLIAGVSIAKVTTLRNKDLRVAGRKADGTWLVMNFLDDQEDIVSVTEIFFDGQKLHYEGRNYTLAGDYCGLFNSELYELNGRMIRFKYSNGESSTTRFSQGISTLQFTEQDDTWDYYSATAIDSGRDKKIHFQGWRATEEQRRKLHGMDQKSVIREFVKTFGPNEQPKIERDLTTLREG